MSYEIKIDELGVFAMHFCCVCYSPLLKGDNDASQLSVWKANACTAVSVCYSSSPRMMKRASLLA